MVKREMYRYPPHRKIDPELAPRVRASGSGRLKKTSLHARTQFPNGFLRAKIALNANLAHKQRLFFFNT